jgi:DNA polymerase-3 subunit epsilon
MLARLFGPVVELPPELATRLTAWRALRDDGEQVALDEATFVVVDVETSGLNPRRDRLLAIGACTLHGARLVAGAAIQRLLYQAQVSTKENILVHGIAPTEQATGLPAEQALMDFMEYAGRHVLVAYHAVFDRTVLDRVARETLGVRLHNRWLDLAYLAPALYPEARLPNASLDEWLYRFGIQVATRHRAVDDVLATGELLLVLLKRAKQLGMENLGALMAAAEVQQQRSTI